MWPETPASIHFTLLAYASKTTSHIYVPLHYYGSIHMAEYYWIYNLKNATSNYHATAIYVPPTLLPFNAIYMPHMPITS